MASRASQQYIQRYPIRRPRGILLLKVEDIDWIEAANQYVRLHLGEQSYLDRDSMKCLANRLDPSRFRRIHRSAIVNLVRIRELRIESPNRRQVVLENGRRIPISPEHWEDLREAVQWAC